MGDAYEPAVGRSERNPVKDNAGPPAPTPEDFPDNFGKEIQHARDDRSATEKLWDVCGLLIEGHQNIHLTGGGAKKRYQQGQASRHGERSKRSVFIFNRIFTPYRNLLSKFSVVYPSVGVGPSSVSYDDIIKAAASEEAYQWYWHKARMKRVWAKVVRGLIQRGNSALHVFWSESLKEIVTKAVSSYDLLWEADVTDPEESEWLSVRTLYRKRVLAKAYPEHRQRIMAASLVRDPERTEAPKNRVEVWDVYFRDGRHGVLMGDTWLWTGRQVELPEGIMPVIPIRYTIVEGVSHGIGAIQNAVDLQLIYNRKANQITDGLERYSDPKVMIPRRAEVNDNAFQARGSEKIHYDEMGGKPWYLHGPGVSEQAIRDLLRIESEIQDVLGIHATSLGKTAKNVSSGAHVDSLAEKDTSQLQVSQDEIEYACEDHAVVVLSLMQAHYTEERSLRMFDEAHGRFVFRTLKNTDLVKVPEVFIEGGSMFKDGILQRRQEIVAQVDAGVITAEEAAQELSLGVRNRKRLKKLRGFKHAIEMIEGVKKGFEVVVLPTSPLDELEQVFTDYVGEEEFYDLDDEKKERILDVLKQVSSLKAGGGLQGALQPAPHQEPVPPALRDALGGAPAPIRPTQSGGPLADPNNPSPPIADGPEMRGGGGGTL